MKLINENDLIVGATQGIAVGLDIPIGMESFPLERLRFDGTAVIDGQTVSQWYIDDSGLKHLAQTNPTWQSLTCAWDDALILENGTWRVQTSADLMNQSRKTKFAEIQSAMDSAISLGFTCSNGIKMNADITDVQRLRSAYELATELGETDMDLVDYDNAVHTAIPLATVNQMAMEMGANYRTIYFTKQSLRQAALNAADQAALDAIAWP